MPTSWGEITSALGDILSVNEKAAREIIRDVFSEDNLDMLERLERSSSETVLRQLKPYLKRHCRTAGLPTLNGPDRSHVRGLFMSVARIAV